MCDKITLNKAYKIAKSVKRNINVCDEMENGYIFSSKEEVYNEGGSGPVVILKDDGRAVNFLHFTFVMHEGANTYIKSYDLDENGNVISEYIQEDYVEEDEDKKKK